MTGFPQQRRAAVTLDPWFQIARRLYVVDHRRAGVARQHVGGEQHELPVGIDDVAALSDDAEAVAVAVEREADFGVAALQGFDQVGEILRHRGIRVVIGESAVHLAEEFGHLAAETAIQLRRVRTGDTVAAVDGDFHRPRELHVTGDACEVIGVDVGSAVTAIARRNVPAFDALPQSLDCVARERVARQHDLEPVVIGRVVRARHHYAGQGAEVVGREVEHRGGHAADVDYVDAGGLYTFGERRGEFRAGQPAVAADRDFAYAASATLRTDSAPDGDHQRRGQRFTDDAAYIVRFENFLGKAGHGGDGS